MKNKFTLFVLIFTATFSLSGQTANFDVHAFINGADDETPVKKQSTARNVMAGNSAVTACYQNCNVQFTLSYCGEALTEYPGKDRQQVKADVFQIEPGIWIAELGAGQYIKVNSLTGVTTVDVDGEFRVFAPY